MEFESYKTDRVNMKQRQRGGLKLRQRWIKAYIERIKAYIERIKAQIGNGDVGRINHF